MADDDFRFRIEFHSSGLLDSIRDRFQEREFATELRERLGDHVIVTRDDENLFLYMGSEQDGRETFEAVSSLVSQHGFDATVQPLERWHPIEDAWKDASEPLPESDAAKAAEHKSFADREAADSLEDNLAEWELRIELDSHDSAVELADRLEAEGIKPVVRRWKYLLIGAANQDQANALAERLGGELPEGATISVEAGAVWLYEGTKRHPLSVMFGGLPGPGDQKSG